MAGITQKEKRRQTLKTFLSSERDRLGNLWKVSKLYQINPGAVYRIVNDDGYSHVAWRVLGLEEPPPRKRCCIEDPDDVIAGWIDYLCKDEGITRQELMGRLLGLYLMSRSDGRNND